MDKFNLSTALAFFVSKVFLAYRTNEETRKSIDKAVDKALQQTEEWQQILLATSFKDECDAFAEYWLEDDEQEEGDSNS